MFLLCIIAVALVVAAAALRRRRRLPDAPDVGAVSRQWIVAHRGDNQ
jgi:hypothetical protein